MWAFLASTELIFGKKTAEIIDFVLRSSMCVIYLYFSPKDFERRKITLTWKSQFRSNGMQNTKSI